jgi:hypothetical protein
VRPRDPRRLLAHRRDPARVKIVVLPQSGHAPDGSVSSKQTAELTMSPADLDRIWTGEYLERLARTYWSFLTKVSLGVLRVLYSEDSREIVVLTRPLVLLRFRAPEYELEADSGTVTWRIERGLLVAPAGRGKGYLRLSVSRMPVRGDEVTVWVTSEVNAFYPMIAGWGWFARIGRAIYRETQLRVHVLVTHAFLRSLARLDFETSMVGRLSPRRLSRAASSGRGGR